MVLDTSGRRALTDAFNVTSIRAASARGTFWYRHTNPVRCPPAPPADKLPAGSDASYIPI